MAPRPPWVPKSGFTFLKDLDSLISESSANQAVMVSETPVLHTVDVACAALAYWFSLCSELHLDSSLVARTFDLSSAYRQVGLNSEGRSVGYVRVYDPEERCWKIFQAQVLPFGAVKSVHSFLRLARAVWWMGVVGCLLMRSSFYDDYIVFSPPLLSRSTELTAASLFKLLGWIFAEEGRKCKPFDLQCEALGVLFNLANSTSGVCQVTNTQSRVDEISTEIHRLIEQGFVTQKLKSYAAGCSLQNHKFMVELVSDALEHSKNLLVREEQICSNGK